MKLHFEPNLEYQKQAIEAVCDLFRGQELCRTEFTVSRDFGAAQGSMAFTQNELGVGNKLSLLDDELLKNLNEVQLRNGLEPSASLASGDFTVEMETGTGKTYVYLRTVFELNRKYGFTKFVVVVPSVAIKEGVYKTLQITAEHFRGLYANTPFDYFLYDSAKLGQVRNFATSPNIQVMVVTVGAINKKDVNNLYKDSEKTGGEKPIDLISATRPIVIVDEPQSVDGGLEGRGKEALGAMKPLCTLRYSATHVDKHHMVYRLDAVDAYDQKLVKQIEVASATVESAHNKPYVRLVSVSNKRGGISAKVELDVQSASGAAQRKEVAVRVGEDLEQTTGRELYRDCRLIEIQTAKGGEYVTLHVPGGEPCLRPGEAYGDVEPLAIQRQMIRRTIKEHLDKELRLRPQGIKVLSLFFVDSVEKYRRHDADGTPLKGDYARLFEEEYERAARLPAYNTLFKEVDLRHAASEVHGGYFSIDKKKVAGKTVEVLKDTSGATKADDDTYNLIMKDKERLLSLETPLKFLFSHSALREGWDNPNVFQICALRDIRTERERRQTIGRGLRLCVNQQGERLRGFDVNTLTVVATESYEQFAEGLQKEYEQGGFHFGIVEPHLFAAIAVPGAHGGTEQLGMERSRAIWEHLRQQGYLDAKGKVQDALRLALRDGSLSVPATVAGQREKIAALLRKLAGKLEIKNADERRQVRPRQALLHGPEFKALWDRIKHKTTYRVQFDNERLVEECIRAVREAPPIASTRLHWRKADLAIGKAGIEATEREGAATVLLDEGDLPLPDLLTDLQDRTQLTRRTLVEVLTKCGRLDDFKRNPQQFIELVGEAINRCKRLAVIDGIKYQRLGDQEYYAQELFEQQELTGYLKNLLEETKKSVYEQVVCDSETEARFADQLEKNTAVKLYAKLPGWFEVPTPLGNYNPDWAVLIETEEGERLYFVVETKGGLFTDDLRDVEKGKVACGKAHFEALRTSEAPAEYVVARTLEDVLSRSDSRS